MARLEGKVAIVTGASKGIGAAIAEKLAEEGAATVVNYATSDSDAQNVVSRIAARGGRATAVKADVSKLADIQRLFDSAVKEFGKVDVLVNNAGVYEFRPLAAVDENHFDRQFDVNVKGLYFAAQAAAQAFGDRGGSIVNISSVASLSPRANGSVYSATKAAVDALTQSLASELGPKKILVNSVLPGATETEGFAAMAGSAEMKPHAISQTPLGRIGAPRDIVNVVAFLASDEAAWITGQMIPVSGGFR
jgi:3-oxoacyl-[acyl-carrier protein] reductase